MDCEVLTLPCRHEWTEPTFSKSPARARRPVLGRAGPGRRRPGRRTEPALAALPAHRRVRPGGAVAGNAGPRHCRREHDQPDPYPDRYGAGAGLVRTRASPLADLAAGQPLAAADQRL